MCNSSDSHTQARTCPHICVANVTCQPLAGGIQNNTVQAGRQAKCYTGRLCAVCMSAVTIRDEECFLSRVMTITFHNTASVTALALQLGFVDCLKADILGTRRFGRWLCLHMWYRRGGGKKPAHVGPLGEVNLHQ
jgi:hypothetical protein